MKNLLGSVTGSPDGTLLTGVKVFFHIGPTVTAGSGTVTVNNPDGFGDFTGTNQPYFLYNQILAPQQVSAPHRWEFKHPPTVLNFSFSVSLLAAFPAEATTPVLAPDVMPDSIYNAANVIENAPQRSGKFLKNIAIVAFKSGTSLDKRQLAVAYVNGTVVGGLRPASNEDGLYAVRIQDDGTAAPLFAALARLRSLPQIEYAVPEGLDASLDTLPRKRRK